MKPFLFEGNCQGLDIPLSHEISRIIMKMLISGRVSNWSSLIGRDTSFSQNQFVNPIQLIWSRLESDMELNSNRQFINRLTLILMITLSIKKISNAF